MENTEPVIGIDLGTTFSCVGLFVPENNTVEILTNKLGNTTTPSWIAFEKSQDDKTKIIVGESAQTRSNLIYDTKRMIGQACDDEDVQEYQKKWPFRVVAGVNKHCEISVPKFGNIKDWEVSGHVLSYLKSIAETKTSSAVKKAVITVPAYFTDFQKEATKKAASQAGLEVMSLIDEPTAAATAAGFHLIADRKNVLVFDFGGVTLDISILCCYDGELEIKSTNCERNLGGRDIDEALVEYCIKEFQEKKNIDLS